MFSGKVVVFRQKCCNRANVVLIGQSCGILAKVVVLGAKVAVFGHNWLLSGKSGCIRAKCL